MWRLNTEIHVVRTRNMLPPSQTFFKIEEITKKKIFNIQLRAEVFDHCASRRVKTKDQKYHIVNEYLLQDGTGEIYFSVWDEELPVGEWIEVQGAYTREWNGGFWLVLSKRGFWKRLDLLQDESMDFYVIASIPQVDTMVNVKAQVVEIEDPFVEAGHLKQRVLIGDETGVIVVRILDEQVKFFQDQLARIPQPSKNYKKIPIKLINCKKKEEDTSIFLEFSSSNSLSLAQPPLDSFSVNLSRNLSYPDLNH